MSHLGSAQVGIVDSRSRFEELIPPDKDLPDAWLNALTERTAPEVFSGWENELKYIGMPIGGIGCGQLYLGGDGRLWLWDIFKSNYRREPDHGQRIDAFTLGGHYAHPVAFGEEYTPWNGAEVEQGFAVRVQDGIRTILKSLDHKDFPDVTFRGEYPVGKVSYGSVDDPVDIQLEAFSPFIPLNAKDSGIPATIMRFTVENTSDAEVTVDLVGWLQNSTCPYVSPTEPGRRRNRLVSKESRVSLIGTVEPVIAGDDEGGVDRADIVFADFEGESYDGWTVEGRAFSPAPYKVGDLPEYVVLQGFEGERVANSHNVRPLPEDMSPNRKAVAGDGMTGTLTSEPFTVSRDYISFLISGGDHGRQTGLLLLVDDEVVASQSGRNNHQMHTEHFDVRKFAGKVARLQVIDEMPGGWGNTCVDHIVFTNTPPELAGIEKLHGYGSMALSLLNPQDCEQCIGAPRVMHSGDTSNLFSSIRPLADNQEQVEALDEKLVGALGATVKLAPGASHTYEFAITWYFPDYHEVDSAPGFLSQLQNFSQLRRHYAKRFNSAGSVADFLAKNRKRLIGDTRLWNQIWYDSTLPHWLLDRTFLTINCAATQMLHWFDSGRLHGWEGVDCCPGTCTHVWHYAQGLGRIFPELERSFREITDFGVAYHQESGLIGYRAEIRSSEATDGQAGTILRVYREHQTSANRDFLHRLWPRIKKSIQYLMAKDPSGEGILACAQPHTLDAAWYGPMAWVSGLYMAAVSAGAAMAEEMNDLDFARQCKNIVRAGRKNIVSQLFNGEYFIHRPDPAVPNAISSGNGCHIDQVLGQAWAHQVGLERVIPKQETCSALQSLWQYNFAPDAGAYAIAHREIEQAFRWYAMPGEAGLLMCTWPNGGAEEAIPGNRLRAHQNPKVWTGPGGYFNECMNGFEYQVAAHMIFEGEPDSDLVKKGLAIARAIHERYGPSKRNPYNEIECSDHYARSMASYGVFLAVCGFEYHGPKRHIGFAPRVSPDDFRAPYTCAEGWGTFSQQQTEANQIATIEVVWGKLSLQTIALAVPSAMQVDRCVVAVGSDPIEAIFDQDGGRVVVTLKDPVLLSRGSSLAIELS